MSLDGFEESRFEHAGEARALYLRGTGPGVVVMHEVPGITPEVARFARIVADAGFRVYLPHLFGTPSKPLSAGYAVGQLARACISREFHVLAHRGSSPITEWLRALCRHAHAECGGPGVGAIGMCLTGNFALSLMMEPCMLAPVLSQPSLPLPLGAARRAALHVSPEVLANLKRRCAAEGGRVVALRFSNDPLCPPERFRTLRRELGDAFEAIEIDSSLANPEGNPRPHSVVTTDLVDTQGHPTREAADSVIDFFRQRLRA